MFHYLRSAAKAAPLPLALLLAAALPSAPAAAQEEYFTSEKFTVMRDPEQGMCGMTGTFRHPEHGETMLVVLDNTDPKRPYSTLAIVVENANLTGQDGTKEMQIYFVNEGEGGLNDEWGTRTFFWKPFNQGHMLLINVMNGERKTLLDDVASYSALGLYMDGELLTALPLAGAREAVAKVRECTASF